MLGAEQREWLLEDLATTKARWNILASRRRSRRSTTRPPALLLASPPAPTTGRVRRRASGDHRLGVEHQTPNLVVLTGDSHRNWVRDIPRHYTELSTTRSAPSSSAPRSRRAAIPSRSSWSSGDSRNPHLHLRNNNRGYAKCTLTPDTWTTEYRVVGTVEQPASPCRSLATFVVENGTPGAHLAST
jgi:alkaline phosphatase D